MTHDRAENCGLAHLRNLQICDRGMSQEFLDFVTNICTSFFKLFRLLAFLMSDKYKKVKITIIIISTFLFAV
jgi:hypothetical protein